MCCLDQSPPQNSCRPAVDALFSSVGEAYGGAVIAVILAPGMGQDGLRGAEILKAPGASILAQDEASSVVWGMPGAIVNAGLADCVLPLDHIVPEILRRVPNLKRADGCLAKPQSRRSIRRITSSCISPRSPPPASPSAAPTPKQQQNLQSFLKIK